MMDDIKDDIYKIRESQIRTEADIEIIKIDLNNHIRRTEILESLHQDNQTRIEILEEPFKAKKYLMSILADCLKFVGFISAVLGVLKYLGKI